MPLRDRLPSGRTAVMGIVNVTPDSFSDAGAYLDPEAAANRCKALVDDGADLIDIGGESTRPGAEDVPSDEELRRVLPALEAASAMGVPVSIDTRKAAVARRAVDAGASIVNDVSAGTFDPDLLEAVAEVGVDLILMHMRGTPKTMDAMSTYDDVVADVRRELISRVAAAKAAGIPDDRIWVDPGLGFAKGPADSLDLVNRIAELRALGPVVVGPSRKRFVGAVTGTGVDDRLEGTLAVVAWCAMQDVEVVRVHDVRAARRVVETIAAIRQGAESHVG